MSIINEPIKTFKNQALKIWATKDFAERKLAFSRTTWFLHCMYCFCIILTLDTFLIIAVNDMFTLIDFYDTSDFWLYNFIENIYYNIHPLVEVAILFFWFSPIIIMATLKLSKAYSIKEKGVTDWIEFKIKRRFPKYKTSTQRARERLENPKKKGKLNTKYQKWLETKNDVERIIIRGSLWGVYLAFFGSLFFFMLFTTSDTFNDLIYTEESTMTEQEFNEARDNLIDQLIEQQEVPTRPDGLPPSTIYDIFIRSDSVVP